MYSSRYVLQRRLSQSSVTCPPYMISPNRYLRSSHGTFKVKSLLNHLTPNPRPPSTAHLSVSLQVVVQDVNRDRQVSGVEGVFPVPPLRPKLPPLCHAGVEVTQREQDGLELLLPAALIQDVLHTEGSVEPSTEGKRCNACIYLVKVIQRCVQVGVHARGRLVGDLDGIF